MAPKARQLSLVDPSILRPAILESFKKRALVSVDAGQVIPRDGEVVEGIASVDESAITGESAPVIRESGGDRSAVTGGTKVLSDRIVVRITVDPGESFLDRMIGLVEGASRQKTPNEIALHILLVGLTIVFLFACVTLVPLGLYSGIPLSATAIVVLLKEKYQLRGRETKGVAHFIQFSAQTRMSGCDLGDRHVRKGAVDAVGDHVKSLGGVMPEELVQAAWKMGDAGGTPLAVS